jgi:hypothetical protein
MALSQGCTQFLEFRLIRRHPCLPPLWRAGIRTTITPFLVFPARNSEMKGRNMLRRNLMRAAFHSMFDVGRSMFDVRLAGANGRSTVIRGGVRW